MVIPNESINGQGLDYEVVGKGEPLVLVHGSWVDRHSWDPLVALLADDFTVVSFSRRGHGNSECPPGQGSVHEDVADLAALVEHLDMAPAHVVGNSFGASIALRLAGQRPELFRSVSAREPPLVTLLADDPDSQPVLDELGQRFGAIVALLVAGDKPAGAKRFVEEVALGPGQWDLLPPEVQHAFADNADTFLDESNDPEGLTMDVQSLSAYSGPALLTQGEASPPFFGMILTKVGACLSGARRQTIQGAGHVPQMTHTNEYAQLLRGLAGS